MTYHDIYEMSTDDIINMWNRFCTEHDYKELVVYTMAEWRREVSYKHTIPWFLDRLDPERFNPGHEFVSFDTCDDVWVSSDDIFDLVDVAFMMEETMEDLSKCM